eukprot:1864256-Pyramimonas_sp.AAC.1
MGHSSQCLLGYGDGPEDSIEHDCRCRAVCAAFQRKLRLDPNIFCNLTVYCRSTRLPAPRKSCPPPALAIYGVYIVTNTMRHRGRCNFEVAVDAIAQA